MLREKIYIYDSYLPASDDEKSTKPSVLALVILDALDATFGHREVLVLCGYRQIFVLFQLAHILWHFGLHEFSILFPFLDHFVVPSILYLREMVFADCPQSEEGEATRTAEDVSKGIFSRLLEPVSDRILELLVASNKSRPCWMNPSACGSDVLVLLHHVQESCNGEVIEVHVAIKCKKESVFAFQNPLSQRLLYAFPETLANLFCKAAILTWLYLSMLIIKIRLSVEVLKVHALTPALLVADQLFVLQMANNLRSVFKFPSDPSAVLRFFKTRFRGKRGRRPTVSGCSLSKLVFVNVNLVHRLNQGQDVIVHCLSNLLTSLLTLFLFLFVPLERIVKEDMKLP